MASAHPRAAETTGIESLRIRVPDEPLADLRRRLLATRWPGAQDLRSNGVPVYRLRGIVHHWLHHYDWRAREALLNSFGCYRTIIDGTGIDFIHVESPHADAYPILLVHGWPGSVLDFRKVIHALTEPANSDTGHPQSFHVVIPCLPGTNLSGAPTITSWDLSQLAASLAALMGRLGYHRWLAHGGGRGARFAVQLGLLEPEGLEALHLATNDDASAGWAAPPTNHAQAWDIALRDSPAGLAAWLLEASAPLIDADADADLEASLRADDVIDGAMMRWLAYTTADGPDWWPPPEGGSGDLAIPVGCSQFARRGHNTREIWSGLACRDLFYRNQIETAARVPALQQPDVLVAELRRCFATPTWPSTKHTRESGNGPRVGRPRTSRRTGRRASREDPQSE